MRSTLSTRCCVSPRQSTCTPVFAREQSSGHRRSLRVSFNNSAGNMDRLVYCLEVRVYRGKRKSERMGSDSSDLSRDLPSCSWFGDGRWDDGRERANHERIALERPSISQELRGGKQPIRPRRCVTRTNWGDSPRRRGLQVGIATQKQPHPLRYDGRAPSSVSHGHAQCSPRCEASRSTCLQGRRRAKPIIVSLELDPSRRRTTSTTR